MAEYRSFYKTVGGNEGTKCHYPTRLDSYGCGCSHNCSYCYARSLLEFRNLWHPSDPAVADINKIRRKLDKIKSGTVLRLGGIHKSSFISCDMSSDILPLYVILCFRSGISALSISFFQCVL